MNCELGTTSGCCGTCDGAFDPAVIITGEARPRLWPLWLAAQIASYSPERGYDFCDGMLVGVDKLTLSRSLVENNPSATNWIVETAVGMGLTVTFTPGGE